MNFLQVKLSIWLAEIKRISWKLELTCVPDILDPYVSAGGEKQPLDGDEKEADDVWCKRHTYEEDRERLRVGEKRQTIKYAIATVQRVENM